MLGVVAERPPATPASQGLGSGPAPADVALDPQQVMAQAFGSLSPGGETRLSSRRLAGGKPGK